MDLDGEQFDVVPRAQWHTHPLLCGVGQAHDRFDSDRYFLFSYPSPAQASALMTVKIQAKVGGSGMRAQRQGKMKSSMTTGQARGPTVHQLEPRRFRHRVSGAGAEGAGRLLVVKWLSSVRRPGSTGSRRSWRRRRGGNRGKFSGLEATAERDAAAVEPVEEGLEIHPDVALSTCRRRFMAHELVLHN